LTRAAIVGLSGPRLTPAEAELFARQEPAGAILFRRNVEDPAQLVALTADIRGLLGEEAPILIDQEGGRVARLRPPHWAEHKPAAAYEGASEATIRAAAARLGAECARAGCDVVCAPVLDLRVAGAHDVIGDRAFSADPGEVARCGAAFVAGLQQAGCIPVLKHIPGHGRAMADSHLELPRVDADAATLAADLAPFAALARSGAWAMTAHILYPAWDSERCATLSPRIIARVIRGEIGFDGVLVSDDLTMQALAGAPAALAQAALNAGCDLVLHCNGVLADTAALLAVCPALTDAAQHRLAAARDAARRTARLSATA
jgi:beta-N-acetylhexosaminidase